MSSPAMAVLKAVGVLIGLSAIAAIFAIVSSSQPSVAEIPQKKYVDTRPESQQEFCLMQRKWAIYYANTEGRSSGGNSFMKEQIDKELDAAERERRQDNLTFARAINFELSAWEGTVISVDSGLVRLSDTNAVLHVKLKPNYCSTISAIDGVVFQNGPTADVAKTLRAGANVYFSGKFRLAKGTFSEADKIIEGGQFYQSNRVKSPEFSIELTRIQAQ